MSESSVVNLIVALFGIASAFVAGWWKRGGEIEAEHSRMGKLAEIAESTAYAKVSAEEEARLAIACHRLDTVLTNLEAMTSVTEGIRTGLAGGLWERQRRWEIKKDFYLNLINCVDEMRIAFLGPEEKGQVPVRREALEELNRQTISAFLFASREASIEIEKFRLRLLEADNPTTMAEVCADAQNMLVVIARLDLDIDVQSHHLG